MGTIGLATATVLLANQTRKEAKASAEEIAISRTALQTSTRPLLVNAPLRSFMTDVTSPTASLPDGSRPTIKFDRGKIEVNVYGTSAPPDEGGYVNVTVPLHNVGSGIALIRTATIDGFFVPDLDAKYQAAVPPLEVAQLDFGKDIDPGLAAELDADLRYGREVAEFFVEVRYTDIDGNQPQRTRVQIEGRRNWWSAVGATDLLPAGVDSSGRDVL